MTSPAIPLHPAHAAELGADAAPASVSNITGARRIEQIGLATLYLGDCREIAPQADALLTDPPYGIGYDYEGEYDDTPENLSALISAMFPVRASRAVFFASHKMLWAYPRADWVGCVTWNTTGSYGPLGVCQWTPFLFYGKDLAGFGSVNSVLKSDRYSISGGDGVGFRRGEEIAHPCPKPLNIMRWVVARFSAPDELVADPFMGSGTTGVAAVQAGRRFIGCEISPRFFDEACRRIEEAQRQRDLFRDAQP